jgi:hypothetical protein
LTYSPGEFRVNITVFFDGDGVLWYEFTRVLEEHAAFIFRADESKNLRANTVKFLPD